MNLEPLSCSSCGAAVPLGDGATFPCPHCSATVSAPKHYLEWRNEKRANLEAEAHLIELHKRLGKTPNPLEIWLSKIQGGCGCGGCLASFFVFILGSQLLRAGLWAAVGLSWLLGVAPDPDPDAETSVLVIATILFPFLVASVLVVLGLGFVRGKVLALAQLQGKLIASPPTHAGGLSTCRSCGGPLRSQAGQMCSPCYYCGSQNLVSLDPAWCERLRSHTTQSQESLQEAVALYDKETRTASWKMVRNVVVFMLIAWMLTRSSNTTLSQRWPPIGFDNFVRSGSVLLIDPSEPLSLNTPIGFQYHASSSYRGGEFQRFGVAYFLIPLNKGDVLTVHMLKQTEPARIQIRASDSSKTLKESSQADWLTLAGDPATYTAQKKSWHAVTIRPAEADKSAEYELKFSIAGREQSWTLPDLSETSVDGIPLNLLPSEKLTPIPDSSWQTLEGVEVQTDSKGIVKGVRGKSLDRPVPLVGGDVGSQKNWLQVYGPGRIRQVHIEGGTGYSQHELYWERLYDTPTGALRIKQVGPAFEQFELFRGENYEIPAGGIVAKEQQPKGELSPSVDQEGDVAKTTGPTVLSEDFTLGSTKPLTIRGLRPGIPREQAERVLGPPELEWGRYAYYGEETVCFWNGKIRWIHGPKIKLGETEYAFTGKAHSFDEKVDEPLFRINLSGGRRGTMDSYFLWMSLHRAGDDLLMTVRQGNNSELVSGALLSGDLFSKTTPVMIRSDRRHSAQIGSLEIKAGPADLDPLWSYLGQPQLSYLFAHSKPGSLLPEMLSTDSGNEQFYYAVYSERTFPRFNLEFWKNTFDFL